MPASPSPKPSSNKAAALIIVLAFVVLLTGLSLAYFSSTTTDRQLAHSSYNDTSADLLARSALDVVVGDFKQEIVNGSNPTIVSGTTIYIPTNATKMVPQQSGNAAGVANLIRRSVYPDSLSGNPGVASRASAVNSQNNASANGRYISSTRWNAHYLVPKGNTATTDSSPIPAFTNATPDWVIVTRAGPAPFDSWDPALKDPSATNTNYAIGRYAYAVYDEGGLLDMNTVGSPVAPTPIPELLTDIGRKGVPAWDDVSAIVPTPSPVGTPFAKELVGFRNYATTGQNNVSNLNFSFSNNTQIDAFINYVLGAGINQPKVGFGPSGRDFGAVRNDLIASDLRTDQNFVTRAELINFLKTLGNASVGISVNSLQYMGTFSREQNKPTLPLTPDWPYPRIVLPQRFYLGNLNLIVYPSPTPTPVVTPTPTATPTLAPTIRTSLGLEFVNASTSGSGLCDSQVRWKYVGNQNPLNTTPLLAIPAFPSDLTTLDFFQYINYALFGVTGEDLTHIPYTLGIGAALIDMYDSESTRLTGMYYGMPTPTPTPTPMATPTPTATPTPCDAITNAYLVYGAEQNGFLVRSQAATGISPVPTPDQWTSSFFPPANTPFRSVGEFGWTYSILDAANNRNLAPNPKYLIDFKDPYNPNSDPNPPIPDSTHNPDPALLDFFTYNSAPARSGIVSLNTRQPLVLAAILKSGIYQGTNFPLNTLQATQAATNIVSATTTIPAMSRADIARLASLAASAPFNQVIANQDIKDTFARALSEVTQTRTWGLLIDLVAQTGHYKPTATGLADFVVEGEKRYWLHIAIDRFDGTIVGQQLEEVVE